MSLKIKQNKKREENALLPMRLLINLNKKKEQTASILDAGEADDFSVVRGM